MSTSGSEQEPFRLLRTKLHRPRVSDNLVPRPCLLFRFNPDLNRKLTLISAPAGYGNWIGFVDRCVMRFLTKDQGRKTKDWSAPPVLNVRQTSKELYECTGQKLYNALYLGTALR